MKKILFFFIVFFLVFHQTASAHLAGQPPFFKMNGKYSTLYPIQSTTTSPEFVLPQDLGPGNYLINQPIEFEIDEKDLQKIVPLDIIQKTKFEWDFGDLQNGVGLKNTHSYTKVGSYILKIYVDTSAFEKNSPKQLLQSVLFHIVKDKNYQLPKAVIHVNGETENVDPQKNIFQVNFSQPVNLDATYSVTKSSKIVSYFWDFDDDSSSKEAVVSHQYRTPREFAAPALRVIDANGFIADTYVGMKNNPNITNHPNIRNDVIKQIGNLETVDFKKIAGVFLLICIILLLVGLKMKKRSN